jgi:putative phosphonate metabolism protein
MTDFIVMDNGDNGNTRALFFVDQVDYDRAIGGIQGRVPANPFNSPCTQGGCSRLKRLYSGFMADYPRYAIYYVPAPGSDLDRFGGQLLGYDAYSGEDLPFPDGIARIVPDWRDLSKDPRKYGFHATLKAPMSLAHGRTEPELLAACESFAGKLRPVQVITPVVGSISGFIAIVAAAPSTELERLAADCTREFDSFRAPLSSGERARRSPSDLTPRQRDYLDRWGYPYVMEEFRFHMTLTGRLDAERRESILTMLRDSFSTVGLKTLAIDRIALFRQECSDSRFRIVKHWQLRSNA